jgi:hypothetical protein
MQQDWAGLGVLDTGSGIWAVSGNWRNDCSEEREKKGLILSLILWCECVYVRALICVAVREKLLIEFLVFPYNLECRPVIESRTAIIIFSILTSTIIK